MRRSDAERGEGRLGCFLWLLLVGLVAYAGYKIVPVKFSASRFQDFMNEEAAFGSSKGNAQIFQELLAQAKELELPIKKDQIEIMRTRESITIAAHYSVTLEFFGSIRYVWRFEPISTRPLAST